MRELGIYIHIPFCKKKCEYCDFISYSNKDDKVEQYINTLKQEIKENAKKAEEYEISTIYIGGGTPSYIDSNIIVEILNMVKKNYKVKPKAEITIEVNPGTINEEKIKSYARSRSKQIKYRIAV